MCRDLQRRMCCRKATYDAGTPVHLAFRSLLIILRLSQLSSAHSPSTLLAQLVLLCVFVRQSPLHP